MKKVMVVGCGAYMNDGYGCPGEWRCLKAAAMGDGTFKEQSQVLAFVRCNCPGRPIIANIGLAIKSLDMKPDAIHLSSCLANAKPGCPHTSPEDLAKMIEDKFGIPVVAGTHDYH